MSIRCQYFVKSLGSQTLTRTEVQTHVTITLFSLNIGLNP